MASMVHCIGVENMEPDCRWKILSPSLTSYMSFNKLHHLLCLSHFICTTGTMTEPTSEGYGEDQMAHSKHSKTVNYYYYIFSRAFSIISRFHGFPFFLNITARQEKRTRIILIFDEWFLILFHKSPKRVRIITAHCRWGN